jgi:hypothetical protein
MIKDITGKDLECNVLFTTTCPVCGKKYLFFYEKAQEQNEYIELMVGRMEGTEDDFVIEPVEDDELDFVNQALEQYMRKMENEMKPVGEMEEQEPKNFQIYLLELWSHQKTQ